jgi:hypothetical protein
VARAGTAFRAPTHTISYSTLHPPLGAAYFTAITKLDGDAGVICAEEATATAEKAALPLASRPMVRA